MGSRTYNVCTGCGDARRAPPDAVFTLHARQFHGVTRVPPLTAEKLITAREKLRAHRAVVGPQTLKAFL